MTDAQAAGDAFAAWETYELMQPRINVQRIRTQADLEALLPYFLTEGSGQAFHYYTRGWDHKFAYAPTGDAHIKDSDIYAYTYHSGYGDSTERREHHIIGVGGGIAMNLYTRTAVLISELGERELVASDLPPEMLQPVLRLQS